MFKYLSAGQLEVSKEMYIKTGVDLLQPDGGDLILKILFSAALDGKGCLSVEGKKFY